MTAQLALMVILAGTASPNDRRGAPDEEQAYYAARYGGENGPFVSRHRAIDASLTMLFQHAEAEDWGCEWLSLLSRDRYGRWWFSTPKTGHAAGPNQCEVSYSSAEIRRPDSRLVSTAHTHPRGDVFPDPRPNPPDNRNSHPMFLVRSDGRIWHFPARSTTSTLCGQVVKDRGRLTITTQVPATPRGRSATRGRRPLARAAGAGARGDGSR